MSVRPAMVGKVDDQLEQAGDAAGARMGQHLIVHLALVAHRPAAAISRLGTLSSA